MIIVYNLPPQTGIIEVREIKCYTIRNDSVHALKA